MFLKKDHEQSKLMPYLRSTERSTFPAKVFVPAVTYLDYRVHHAERMPLAYCLVTN